MAQFLKVEVTGMDKLKKRLVDIIPKKTEAAVRDVMETGADAIVAQARATVPRRTGALAATIHRTDIRVNKRGALYTAVVAGDDSTQEKRDSGMFQVARVVEFGSQNMPAEPFFFPAYRSNKERIRRAIRTAIKKTVKEN